MKCGSVAKHPQADRTSLPTTLAVSFSIRCRIVVIGILHRLHTCVNFPLDKKGKQGVHSFYFRKPIPQG